MMEGFSLQFLIESIITIAIIAILTNCCKNWVMNHFWFFHKYVWREYLKAIFYF